MKKINTECLIVETSAPVIDLKVIVLLIFSHLKHIG